MGGNSFVLALRTCLHHFRPTFIAEPDARMLACEMVSDWAIKSHMDQPEETNVRELVNILQHTDRFVGAHLLVQVLLQREFMKNIVSVCRVLRSAVDRKDLICTCSEKDHEHLAVGCVMEALGECDSCHEFHHLGPMEDWQKVQDLATNQGLIIDPVVFVKLGLLKLDDRAHLLRRLVDRMISGKVIKNLSRFISSNSDEKRGVRRPQSKRYAQSWGTN